ncbi:MAG TPA: hypothetical protein VMB34_29160 [Acetobacteraceae bacterium]|nr:hypothetical protein [Acetobacteraceae bacterium]
MPHIAVETVEEGLHPSEVVVTLRTADGKTEEVAVDRLLVEAKQLKAYPVGQERDRVLVELPRETISGAWRVWMPKASVFGLTEAVS